MHVISTFDYSRCSGAELRPKSIALLTRITCASKCILKSNGFDFQFDGAKQQSKVEYVDSCPTASETSNVLNHDVRSRRTSSVCLKKVVLFEQNVSNLRKKVKQRAEELRRASFAEPFRAAAVRSQFAFRILVYFQSRRQIATVRSVDQLRIELARTLQPLKVSQTCVCTET